MSTTTLQENKTMKQFTEAAVLYMPNLVCIGYVSTVGDAKVSSSDKYIVQPLTIDGLESARNTKVQLLYKPEWLTENFNPESLNDFEDGKSMHFVYSQHIRQRGGLSTLRGIAGSQEGFDTLSNAILNIPVTKDPEVFMRAVQEVITEFVNNNTESDGTPKKIGYVLSQKSSKVLDSNGNPVKNDAGKFEYVREKQYQVSRYFDVTEEQLKREINAAQKSPNTIKLTFENGIPF